MLEERKARSIGYEQLTSLSAAAALASIPTGATWAKIQATGQNVRWRDDGVNPTTTVGMILYAGDPAEFYTGDFSKLRFIETGASAVVNVVYYR